MAENEIGKINYVLEFLATTDKPISKITDKISRGRKYLALQGDSFFEGILKIETFEHGKHDITEFKQ